MEAELNQCVKYFTDGGVMQWVAGGAVVILVLVTTFTRANVPSFVKSLVSWLAANASKKGEDITLGKKK